jgi:hypothetical protein
MTRRILFSLAAAVSLIGVTAGAHAAATYRVIGSVPQVCTVSDPQLLAGVAPINVSSLTAQAITITDLVDSRTLAVNAASFGVGFNAFCNYAHRLIVESQNNGLWRQDLTPAAQGFADAVPYTAEVRWGGTDNTLQANAAVRQITDLSVPVNNPASGQIELRVQILSGASNALSYAPLLAGAYSDIIRVTVEPQ